MNIASIVIKYKQGNIRYSLNQARSQACEESAVRKGPQLKGPLLNTIKLLTEISTMPLNALGTEEYSVIILYIKLYNILLPV